MAQAIPLSNAPRQTFRTVLGGTTVRVRVWWQPLDENWYLSLQHVDAARTSIVAGARLTSRGRPFEAHTGAFTGAVEVDSPNFADELPRNAWTSGVRLLYRPVSEL